MKKINLPHLNRFYRWNLYLLCVLALVRCAFPQVMEKQDAEAVAYNPEGKGAPPVAYLTQPLPPSSVEEQVDASQGNSTSRSSDSLSDSSSKSIQGSAEPDMSPIDDETLSEVMPTRSAISFLPLPDTTRFSREKHRIYSVPDGYVTNFPDIQDVQYPSACRWGIRPLRNRDEFERVAKDLVYVGSNPYIHLDERMTSSIPYLVPRASDLLQHLGKAFMDSLYAKRIPLHKFVVSSVLRTEADVARLSVGNVNATQRSCHLFGTTFDISYNHYYTVSSPDGPRRRAVRDDSLKMVLSEVLRDARREGRCYVRYEIKQPCFHITVR